METLVGSLHLYILPDQWRGLSRCCRMLEADSPPRQPSDLPRRKNNLCWKKTEISGKEAEESKSQTLLLCSCVTMDTLLKCSNEASASSRYEMKTPSTFKCWHKTSQKYSYSTQPSAWQMVGVQSTMAVATGTRGLFATPEATKGWAGHGLDLENSMTYQNLNKTQTSEKELFLCSSNS